jgi:hypothetical protein
MPIRDWMSALNRLMIMFDDRISNNLKTITSFF